MSRTDMPVIVYMGTPEFAVPSLQALIDADMAPQLVITQPDRPQGRKLRLTPPPVKVAAEAAGLPVLQPESMRGEEGREVREVIRELGPDLIVTASYGHILPESLLKLARVEAVNVHGSLLPKYRGASPVQQAIIQGETETGISIIRMVRAMDAGPIFRVAPHAIGPNTTADELMGELADLAARILPETLQAILEGSLEPVEQLHEAASYVSMLTRETGAIDWTQSAQTIHNLIRGTYAWPGAYSHYQGDRVKIHQSLVTDRPSEAVEPGTIVDNLKGLFVQTGEGVLHLVSIQPAGKKIQATADTSHNYAIGSGFEATS